MKREFSIVSEETVYQGFYQMKKLVLQHELFVGGMTEPFARELFVRPAAAAALLYDPDRDELVMLEQFRVGALDDPISPWMIEVVAGLIESGETPEQVVRRETEEEAGLVCQDVQLINEFWASPGGASEKVSLFCARVDATNAGGIFGLGDEHEDIRVFVVSAEDAFKMATSGEIRNDIALMALYWLQTQDRKNIFNN